MFDEELGLYNENSLDLLLKFSSSNEQDDDCPSTNLFSTPCKEMPQTEDFLEPPFEDIAQHPLETFQP